MQRRCVQACRQYWRSLLASAARRPTRSTLQQQKQQQRQGKSLAHMRPAQLTALVQCRQSSSSSSDSSDSSTPSSPSSTSSSSSSSSKSLHAFPETGRHVLDLLDGFRRSQTLFSAVSLGVFDFVEAEQPAAEDVANGLGLSLDGATRLLDACCGLGLLRKQGHLFENTDVARAHLLSSSPHSFVGYVRHSKDVLYPLWGQINTAVEQGRNVWQEAFGASPQEVFANMYADSKSLERFLAGMHSMGSLSSPKVVDAFDLSRCRVALDVAGGTGHLAMALCHRYPHAVACVADLPDVLPVTTRYIADANLSARITTTEVDMFETIPSTVSSPTHPATAGSIEESTTLGGAHDGNAKQQQQQGEGKQVDLIMLSRILHDWDDGRCMRILRNCHTALPSKGKVLLAEMLLRDDTHRGPVAAQLQSLNMLVQTHGRERSCREYTTLLHDAGFTDVQCKRTGVYLDAIIATKP